MDSARGSEWSLGETRLEDGFRRVSRFPEPLALSRMRAMLLDISVGGGDLLGEAVAGFEQWRHLATLCDSAWAAGARRDSGAARRVLQRRLRVLGTRPISMDDAAEAPAGTPVHLRGVARAMPFLDSSCPPDRLKCGPQSHIWVVSATNTDNVSRLVERAHDFFVADDTGRTVCVIAAGGHLINAAELRDGDAVSVFGFVDRVADARADGGSPHARGQLALAVRSGDALPLLVRRASA